MAAGRKIYELRVETVQDIIDDTVSAYAPQTHLGKDLALEVEVAPDLPDVVVDRAAIVDAVVNLVSNAHKYGGTPPTVRLLALLTPKGEVGIAVTDNGEGIPRPEQRRIFEKFYRIDDRLSRSKEGSGLGLAIVKHVARAHHARVTVESAPGQGSRFTLVLPPAPPSREANAKAKARAKVTRAPEKKDANGEIEADPTVIRTGMA
jgi:two-component system phosphate regulon sensor histidine kinase PhoR